MNNCVCDSLADNALLLCKSRMLRTTDIHHHKACSPLKLQPVA